MSVRGYEPWEPFHAARRWVAAATPPRDKFLVLTGQHGAGKSAIVRALGLPVFDFADVVRRAAEEPFAVHRVAPWRVSEGAGGRWRRHRLFCVDDLRPCRGRYGLDAEQVAMELIQAVTVTPHVRCVLTTNLVPGALRRVFGPAVASRLRAGEVVTVPGPDRRGDPLRDAGPHFPVTPVLQLFPPPKREG